MAYEWMHIPWPEGSTMHSKRGTPLCGDGDNKLSLLEAHSGKEVWTNERERLVKCCAFSPNGQLVLCGDGDDKLSLLDAQSG